MHGRFADVRPSERGASDRLGHILRSEEYKQQSNSYDESFLRRENKDAPVLMKSNSSEMVEQPYRPDADKNRPTDASDNENNKSPSNASSIQRIPALTGSAENATSIAPSRSYRDREMLMHQSIIYNRARAKLEQQNKREQEKSAEKMASAPRPGGRASPTSFLTRPSPTPQHSTTNKSSEPQASPNSSVRFSTSIGHSKSEADNTETTSRSRPAAPVRYSYTGSPLGDNKNKNQKDAAPVAKTQKSSTITIRHTDGQSVISGVSNPFDEKTSFSASLPIVIPSVTPDRSTAENSNGTARSGAESSTASTFWKHAEPPPVINHRVNSTDRFKVPPPRIMEPAAGYMLDESVGNGTTRIQNTAPQPAGGMPKQDSARRSPTQMANYNPAKRSPTQMANYNSARRSPTQMANYNSARRSPTQMTNDFQAPSVSNSPHVPRSLSRDGVSSSNEPLTRHTARVGGGDKRDMVYEEEKKEDLRRLPVSNDKPPDLVLNDTLERILNSDDKAQDIILNHDDASIDNDSLFQYLADGTKVSVPAYNAQQEMRNPPPPPPNRNKTPKKKIRHRNSRNYPDDIDDSSIETPAERNSKITASPASLTLRAQEAWKRNRKLDKSARAAASPSSPKTTSKVTRAPAKDSPSQRGKVSFGTVDTVHHYPNTQPDASTTYSQGSEYTKSMESEVEDLFKDFLLIGDGKDNKPGKKKIKQRYGVDTQDESTLESLTEDEGTLKSDDDTTTRGSTLPDEETVSDSKSKESNKRLLEQDEDPLLTGVWNMMESGVGAVIGLITPVEEEDSASMDDQSQTQNSSSVPSTKQSTQSKSLFGYVSESLLGTSGLPESSSMPDEIEGYGGTKPKQKKNSVSLHQQTGVLRSAPSLDQDLRLIQLATESARMFHRMHGYEFDESKEVDIMNEIKFVVADLKLPMGMVFQENPSGCWITRIMPEGSAARTNVEVGDQLAAIDGISAINMRVDQVADAVRNKKNGFELTLLRYVGKLHTSSQQEKANEATKWNSRPTTTSQRPSSRASLVKERNQRLSTTSNAMTAEIEVREEGKRLNAVSRFGRKPENVVSSVRVSKPSAKPEKRSDTPALFGQKHDRGQGISNKQLSQAEPKKKRFGLFGRKKKAAQ